MFTFLTLVVGLVVLTVGAELLVRNASGLAAAWGISPLVIGLTVVAFGTSAPELVVSVQSAWQEQPDIALGNVIGSNIFNVLFILGISALIIPLRVSRQLIRVDVPIMIALSALVLLLASDGRIGRWDGALLLTGLVIYTVWSIVQSRKSQVGPADEFVEEFSAPPGGTSSKRMFIQVVLLSVGLLLLILGARWFTGAAIIIARQFHVSELVIGLTIVAAGTSLPEVATSIMAALRGERDIAVGNVVGSNIFNIMGVLGCSSLVSSSGIGVSDAVLYFDLPVMFVVTAACLPIFFTGHLIARWEGGLFFAYYVAYTTYLVLAAVNPAVSRTFSVVILGFVLPLTAVTLAIGFLRALRAPNNHA